MEAVVRDSARVTPDPVQAKDMSRLGVPQGRTGGMTGTMSTGRSAAMTIGNRRTRVKGSNENMGEIEADLEDNEMPTTARADIETIRNGPTHIALAAIAATRLRPNADTHPIERTREDGGTVRATR